MLVGLGFLSDPVGSVFRMGNGAAESFDDRAFDDRAFGEGYVDDGFVEGLGEAPGAPMPDEAETIALLADLEPGPTAMMILGGLADAGLDADARI